MWSLEAMERREEPVTANLAPVLASRELLLRIDAALRQQDPGRRGWILADATRPGLPGVRIDVRPFLLAANGTPGLRAESAARPFRPEELPPQYGLVLVASDPGEMQEDALQALRSVVQRQRPFLCLYSSGDGGPVMSRDGTLAPLPAAPSRQTVGRLRITLRGREDLDLSAPLPAQVRIRSAEPQGFFFVRSPLSAGEGKFERFEVESRDGSPLGEALLRLDLAIDGEADRLVITPCEEDRIRIRRADGSPSPSRERPLRLHVIFDRTTLDRAAWQRAFWAASLWAQKEEPSPSPMVQSDSAEKGSADRSQRGWNREIRSQLAEGLRKTVLKLHRRVTLDLWWFADVPRPGMAPPDGLPVAPSAWGHFGTRRLENLSEALASTDFDYACGMDLFDAVDEALEQVVARIRDLGEESHAVLVVGDSPPPPADEQDPLWRRIVDGPTRTNARRSPKFHSARSQLDQQEIPVGWLFVRHPKSPDLPAGKDREMSLFLDAYPRFQTLRESILAALQQLGLLIEGCDGVEDFERSLGALFQRMKKAREAVSRLAIEEA